MKKSLKGIFAVLLSVTCFSAASAQAGPKEEFYYQRYLQRLSQKSFLPPDLNVKQGTFDQKTDHDSPSDTKTFQQRYYINSAHAEGPSAPVLYYICGEATCTENSFRGAIVQHAKQYKAHMVALEHRYYGRSQPFESLTTENMRFLSTEQALDDLATFQKFASTQLGLSGKWIVIGGSYAGSLAAYYRMKYPELAVGALASSGPVMAKADFEEYDQTVSRAAGPDCAAAMRVAVAKAEASLANPAEALEMKRLFGAEEVINNVDFMYVIADMGAIAVQYGFRDQFCGKVLQGDPLTGYAEAGKEMLALFGITPVQMSFQGAVSLNPDDYLEAFGMRAWMYQSCTEYGYYQIAHHDPAVSVRSPLINQPYHDEVCKRLFGIEKPVDTSYVNRRLYQPLLQSSTSRILFTNGSTDPWATLSITRENGNDTNPNTTAFTIEGAAHCDDLGSRKSESLDRSRKLFSELLTVWLK
jgi:pimeloyl-ACP methyl ester carboxylesterase